MRRAILFDQNKCLSCQACVVACKDWNQVNPGPVKWRTAKVYETNEGGRFYPLSMGCNHCANPACVSSCSIGAIIKRPDDGIVYVDRDKCQGLKSCVLNCPFEKPQIADNTQEPYRYEGWMTRHPMQKCDFCMERVDEGKKPICVESCPSFALEIGDYDDLLAKYASKGATQLSSGGFPYAYKLGGKTDTDPSFLIIKRQDLIFTEDID